VSREEAPMKQLMKHMTTARLVAVAVLAAAGVLTAHHSLVQFDTTTPLRVKGTVVRFDLVNPHVRFFLDQAREDGQMQRWAVDGPPSNNLARMGIGPDFLKAGDVVEVCGFALKEGVASQRSHPQASSKPNVLSGRTLSGHLLVMPDGKRQYWSDYGVLEKCLNPGEDRETLRREAFGR
jgi:Family of unknown function (DUF6152)